MIDELKDYDFGLKIENDLTGYLSFKIYGDEEKEFFLCSLI